MLAGGTRRIVRTGPLDNLGDLPLHVVQLIWRIVAVLEGGVSRRIQSIRRGLVVRRGNLHRQSGFAIRNHIIRLFGIHTEEDARFLGASLLSEQRLGLNSYWWRKYYRNVPTREQHWSLMAPTTTSDNMMVQAQQNPWMIANLQVNNNV